ICIVGRLTWQSIYTNAQSAASSGPVARRTDITPPSSTLQPGDTGEEVRTLSETMLFLAQWLNGISLWESGEPLDTFDDALEAAVRGAQRELGLPVTGIVTPTDWRAFYNAAAALFAATPATASPEPEGIWPGYTLTLGSSGPAVLQVQRWLNRLASVNCTASFVPETGTLDEATAQALEAYQIAAGLTPLGMVDDATWESLQAAANAVCPDCPDNEEG
ncbi:MAG: peptidoglycan-binding protein, partial [Gemmiger sp.]